MGLAVSSAIRLLDSTTSAAARRRRDAYRDASPYPSQTSASDTSSATKSEPGPYCANYHCPLRRDANVTRLAKLVVDRADRVRGLEAELARLRMPQDIRETLDRMTTAGGAHFNPTLTERTRILGWLMAIDAKEGDGIR